MVALPIQPIQTLRPTLTPPNPLQKMMQQYAAALKGNQATGQGNEFWDKVDEVIPNTAAKIRAESDQPEIKTAALDPSTVFPTDTKPSVAPKAVPSSTTHKSSTESTPPSNLGEAARNLSSRGETSKTGKSALFNISPDTKGSKSYGPFGLNNKSGSLRQFLGDNPELGLPDPDHPDFDSAWKKAAATDDRMQAAHDKWHQKNIMGGLTSQMTKAGVNPDIASDPRVQIFMADRKVQMGGVGVNTALNYARSASTPDEFIKKIHQIDKSRLGINFKSYLSEHPDHIKGLENRNDLRLNTALASIDPKFTSDMISSRMGTGDPAAGLTKGISVGDSTEKVPGMSASPTKVAEDTRSSKGDTTVKDDLVHGTLERQWSESYGKALSLGYSPERAAEFANNVAKSKVGSEGLAKGLMPQITLDAYGQPLISEPGKIPRYAYPGSIPGFPGKIENLPDVPGALHQTKIGPGGPESNIIIPGVTAPSVKAPGATPPVVPTPPTAPTPLTTPPPKITASPVPAGTPPSVPATPGPAGGILSSTPPVSSTIAAKPGTKFAMADLKDLDPVEELYKSTKSGGSRLTELAKGDKIEIPSYDLSKPKTPEEVAANEHLKWADENPPAPLTTPDRFTEAMRVVEDPKISPYEKLDALRKMKGLDKADVAALEDEIKAQVKGFSELQKNIRDTQKQSLQLAPELKVARNILYSPDFHSGPMSKTVETVRGLREEAESTFRTWAEDAKRRNESDIKAGRKPDSNPELWARMADWVKGDHSATANQVYLKILSGSILQSLRGMLGPNAGQFRVQELKMLEQAFGNPNLTLDANKAVMSMIDKINDRNMLIGQMADKYIGKHRKLDSSFETALSQFEQKHPVFTPDEYNELFKIGATGKTSTEPTPRDAIHPEISPDIIERELERRRGLKK